MIALINIGRAAMLVWVVYGLVLIFAPGIIHQQPAPASGVIQCLIAYGIGYALDRLLSVVRRRKAAASMVDTSAS